MRSYTIFLAALSLSCTQLAAGHPGEDHAEEALRRREFLQQNVANLDHCAGNLDALGVTKRSIERRQNLIHGIREKRGLKARNQAYEAQEYAGQVDQTALFGSKSSCVLAPDTIVGPYYVAGESIRSNIVEDQIGVPLHIDVQFINSATCRPIVGSYVDAWQANATGVYGGVVQEGFEDRNDPWEETWGKTWLRGVQRTDRDGAVHFESIFPGHYAGRAIHIHVLSHLSAKPLPNNTIIDVRASHVGQMYFDQDLVDAVEQLAPYKDNKQPSTTNDEDFLLQADLQAGGYPFMQYELVGDRLEEGILAWLSFGINATENQRVQPVTTYHPKPKATLAV